MKRRVVITGAGIVSCIGNDWASVEASLREGRSGIRAMPEFKELGLRSQVAGKPDIDIEARKILVTPIEGMFTEAVNGDED